MIRPGDLGQPAAGINPLEPAAGPGGSRFPLQTHADLLRALFLAAFQADEPFPQVLAAALTRATSGPDGTWSPGSPPRPACSPRTRGWRTCRPPRWPWWTRSATAGRSPTTCAGSSPSGSGQPAAGHHRPVPRRRPPPRLRRAAGHNVVLEIEDAGDDRDKAFLMGAVLIRLAEHLRLRHRAEARRRRRLRHLTVIEEAHRLLRQPPPGTGDGPAAQATEMFADLLAEVRAYGEGLMIAEQIPAKLIPDAIKNTAVKIVHRLPAADDRDAVGATMNLTAAQSQYLVTLPPGEAAVHADGMDYPLLARMPDGTARETATRPHRLRRAGDRPPQPHLRPRLPGRAVHAGPDARRPARRRHRPADHPVGRADRRRAPDRLGMPRPSPAFTAGLRAMDPRLRDCALSHAADAAVAARVTGASAPGSAPAALAAHVSAAMRQVIGRRHTGLRGRGTAVPRAAVPLDAGPRRAADRRPRRGRHPRSDEWEHAYGEPVPGAPPPSSSAWSTAGSPATSATPGPSPPSSGAPAPAPRSSRPSVPAPTATTGPPGSPTP